MQYNAKNLFFNISYADIRLENAVNIVMHILNDIIITTNQTTPYKITVNIDELMDAKTYGMASWDTYVIWLNNTNFDKTSFLNDISFDLNVCVLLHEILHVTGLIGSSRSHIYIHDKDDSPPNVYTGPKGLEQYIKLLQSFQVDTSNMHYLPLENDFGDGTENSHLEEGIDSDYNREHRIIDGTTYPSFSNEIMTGMLGSYNYITPITLGLLEDMDFTVNYGSQYVLTTGKYLRIV
jgi:hypothetical protein